MHCLTGKVMVQRDPEKAASAGGIVIPEDWRRAPNTGIVLATGSREVAVGDRIMFSLYGGHEFKKDDEPCVVIRERDLIAIVPEGCHVS